MPSKQQVSTWTNDDPAHGHIYASHILNDINAKSDNFIQ